MGSVIRKYAQDLTDRHFFVLIPNYFEKTDTVPDVHVFSQASNLGAWTEAVDDACAYATTAIGTSVPAPGLLGFSLGGNICLRPRGSACVVEFFAPGLVAFGGIGVASGLEKPPVQIHHGLADAVVPFAESQEIGRAPMQLMPRPAAFLVTGHSPFLKARCEEVDDAPE